MVIYKIKNYCPQKFILITSLPEIRSKIIKISHKTVETLIFQKKIKSNDYWNN